MNFVQGSGLAVTQAKSSTSTVSCPAPNFRVPPWAGNPAKCCLRVLKGGVEIDEIDLSSANHSTFGRLDSCSVVLEHPSCSRTHAALVHHNNGTVYLIDLNSAHGTFIDSNRLEPNKPQEIKNDQVISFGVSTRKYVFQLATSAAPSKKGEAFGATTVTSKPSEPEIPEVVVPEEEREELRRRPSVRCSHILIKHSESRNPHDKLRDKPVVRGVKEANAIITGISQELKRDPSQFEKIAKDKSECVSGKRGGDLGEFPRGKMQKTFEDAAFCLRVGEVSKVVSSESGLHLIKCFET